MTRARALSRRVALALAVPAGRLVRGLPGLAAMGCAVAGVWGLLGWQWGLIAAVPFLLLLDAKTPGAR